MWYNNIVEEWTAGREHPAVCFIRAVWTKGNERTAVRPLTETSFNRGAVLLPSELMGINARHIAPCGARGTVDGGGAVNL